LQQKKKSEKKGLSQDHATLFPPGAVDVFAPTINRKGQSHPYWSTQTKRWENSDLLGLTRRRFGRSRTPSQYRFRKECRPGKITIENLLPMKNFRGEREKTADARKQPKEEAGSVYTTP